MLATLAQRRLTWCSPQLERAFLPIQRSAAFKIDAMRRLAFRRVAANYHLNPRAPPRAAFTSSTAGSRT